MMRRARAMRSAAMHSPAIVSSPRIFCTWRSHGSASFSSGAKTERTSEMLAVTVLGATRRAS
eukprot:4077532-Prymnesium_polylepis.1